MNDRFANGSHPQSRQERDATEQLSLRQHQWQFSLRTLLIGVTISAIASACVSWLGGRLAAAAALGAGYACVLTCLVFERASRSLQRRLRKSPLERITVAICWTGIECGVLVGGASVAAVAWEFARGVHWASAIAFTALITIVVLAATLTAAAYCGVGAFAFSIVQVAIIAIASTHSFRMRYEKQLASLCGGSASTLISMLLPLDALDQQWMKVALVAVLTSVGIIVPPIVIWLADRRFPMDEFRAVSRETRGPFAA